MASPAPALVQLRSQLRERWPGPPGVVDWIMGDAAHRLRKSAHNRGDALDARLAAHPGLNMDQLVADLCRQMRANPGGRLQLIIWKRRIYRTRDGWQGARYFGPNPHSSHAHIEVRPELRHVTRPWTLRG